MRASPFLVAMVVLAAGAAIAAWDLSEAPAGTVVVYTTPALRDVLEQDVAPRFERATGYHVALVYVAAGQQYNRLRMSPGHEEAGLFLHASPLYLEKGAAEGFFAPHRLPQDAGIPDALKGAPRDGGRTWTAFAWSPLVEVYAVEVAQTPDLLTTDLSFGLPHPRLSNNGAYAALLFEAVSPAAGANALAHTRVQPVNARATIGGIPDGSFQLTLGYEAVVKFFQAQGAEVRYDLPLMGGDRVTTPVLFAAALVAGEEHPGAQALLQFLFEPETQGRLAAFHFRPAVGGAGPLPEGAIDTSAGRTVAFDWSRWAELERALQEYVVT